MMRKSISYFNNNPDKKEVNMKKNALLVTLVMLLGAGTIAKAMDKNKVEVTNKSSKKITVQLYWTGKKSMVFESADHAKAAIKPGKSEDFYLSYRIKDVTTIVIVVKYHKGGYYSTSVKPQTKIEIPEEQNLSKNWKKIDDKEEPIKALNWE